MTKTRDWKRKYKVRKDIKWTEEISEWIRALCPLREHGYQNRQELLDDLNKAFGTSFSVRALCTHCYESGIQLGLAKSESGIVRGERHWRHRPVGSLQTKKGYVRIKVAEPNEWMQYQRYVWEQAHPGESAAGMTVIFMDGDNRNFDPSNLERVTRGELSVMAELGHTADMTRGEREAVLLRARIAIAMTRLAGKKKAVSIKHKAAYERVKDSPEHKEKARAAWERRYAAIKADPARYAEMLAKQRAYRAANRERCNAWAREYHRRKRKEGK
ncbi:MAG: HNH endonuclease [Treponema sp.]|nr:HNH endonuclease [Treponema sp.]